MSEFKLEAHKAVKKDLKRISQEASREIVNEIFLKISQNPFIGISLSGPLKDYFKFVFNFRGVSYRIIYQIYFQEKIIFIIAIGSRENFYERLLKRIF